MEWLLIVVSLTVIWVASLCKVLHESLSGSKATFLDDGRGSLKRNVLLVIAHPDDESMFFAPTINYLTSKGHNVHILCMSTGNADGMGDTRKQELYLAAATLKVSPQQVNILDHPDLQDGFGKIWNSDLLAGIVKEEVDGHSIDVVISFDNYGVSGHCNHCDVHRENCCRILHTKMLKHGSLSALIYCANTLDQSISGCLSYMQSSIQTDKCISL
ncbi:probable N-acetylglucosaminyl-phosphatidylinositol de-N-acetylase isoform X2 [Ipomoea triloba]|uniref:probable N-acetylglucosaminyl-phosphatidylinositol de-N-acetylase isoform X2 n=1 Tax=Ipomoea triloba TaxID=35885 RepID=UPI00125DF3BC|nr:probable N-acetylglucosaminyl-phosphatidylinositol de-N-acetylase isoform X2 [Ipomoea triloba]